MKKKSRYYTMTKHTRHDSNRVPPKRVFHKRMKIKITKSTTFRFRIFLWNEKKKKNNLDFSIRKPSSSSVDIFKGRDLSVSGFGVSLFLFLSPSDRPQSKTNEQHHVFGRACRRCNKAIKILSRRSDKLCITRCPHVHLFSFFVFFFFVYPFMFLHINIIYIYKYNYCTYYLLCQYIRLSNQH